MTLETREIAAAKGARRVPVLFTGMGRGLIEVTGEDRVRWLDGMISGDVEALESGPSGSGCYAMLLTNRGAIVADVHVARIGEVLILETLASEVAPVMETLRRFIIADDVDLTDRTKDFASLGLEGPGSGRLLASLLGDAALVPSPENWIEGEIGGQTVRIGAFGWSGEEAYQIWVPEAAPGDERMTALIEAIDRTFANVFADEPELLRGSAEVLEILRIEAGIPALGRELDEEVLPPEARLERAIAVDKGCYVGQEIVARLRARGQVNHLLVGFRIEAGTLPEEGLELTVDGRRTGEFTSVVESPTCGAIALGYVRREHADPGTVVTWDGGEARVESLPFTPLGAAVAGSDGAGTIGSPA